MATRKRPTAGEGWPGAGSTVLTLSDENARTSMPPVAAVVDGCLPTRVQAASGRLPLCVRWLRVSLLAYEITGGQHGPPCG